MMSLVIPVPTERTPMFAACGSGACDYVWVAVWLPMEMSLAARVLQSIRCPLCGHESPRCASAGDTEKIQIMTPTPNCTSCGRSPIEHIIGQACPKFTQEAEEG